MSEEDVRCWNCHLHGENILDEFGCCKRCGTNLKKWRYRRDLPDLSDEKVAREVLGTRWKFNIPNDNGQDDW